MKPSSSAPNLQGCDEPIGASELASSSSRTPTASSSPSSCKYKGVRKRKWGKYVSEIRLPNCRDRIWLGSYDTAEKAARAFDAALYCLRGRNAKFNFPDDPPEIPNGGSMTPAEIQVAAARFARAEPGPRPGRVESRSNSFSSRAESPCPSLSGNEFTEMPLDNAFYDQLLDVGTQGSNVPDYGFFPGFGDDYSGNINTTMPTSLDYNYWEDNNNDDELSTQSSFLWNF